MPKIDYVPKRFTTKSVQLIEHANTIIDEYLADDLKLTLRQLYYQFVARDLIPNTHREYKKLGKVVADARLAGLIDWEAIEDRTRKKEENSHWSGPASIVRACADQFAIDKWADQPFYVEVWIEKEALAGILEAACKPLDVTWFSCRGYVSLSEMWVAARRIMERAANRKPVIIHLGDHDPSGMDMTRDIVKRMDTFLTTHGFPALKVDRIALNYDQVEEYQPPPNPTKLSDSRADGYVEEYGYSSWELDALNPTVLIDLIQGTVTNHMDQSLFEKAQDIEHKHRAKLRKIALDLEG